MCSIIEMDEVITMITIIYLDEVSKYFTIFESNQPELIDSLLCCTAAFTWITSTTWQRITSIFGEGEGRDRQINLAYH